MNRNSRLLGMLVLALAGLVGCSSQQAAKETKQVPLDKIQGKAQVLTESTNATDAALNAGGQSVYLWQGLRRYRLFLRNPVDVVHGKEYVAEGVYAQKMIDEIGDPDQGKNGYPLTSSCERVVKMAWPLLAMDAADTNAQVLCARIKRYPARPVFLVTKISPAEVVKKPEAGTEVEGEDLPEVKVPAEKQKALLVAGPTVLTAPLWAPTGGTATCKLVIGRDGKVAELETGVQLCETVPWSDFQYKPTMKAGKPVRVETEVEVKFEARK